MNRTAGIVIGGAGITGVAAAHYLSKAEVKDILLLDKRAPLSFTKRDTTPYVSHRAIGLTSSLSFSEACGVQS